MVSGLGETPKELESKEADMLKHLLTIAKHYPSRSTKEDVRAAAYNYGLVAKRWRHMQRKVKKLSKA